MPTAPDICICVLFYGDSEKYTARAQRVLNAPLRQLAAAGVEFRFGCNAVGPDTRDFLSEQRARYFSRSRLIDSDENLFKYPMMRRMFYESPIAAPLLMWFDHDSLLSESLDVMPWLARVRRQMTHSDMVGSIYRARVTDAQDKWIRSQAWFTGKEINPYVSYAHGGWWVVRTNILHEFNWPAIDLAQNDGDVVFGELMRQQNLLLSHFRDGVMINVNDSGVEAAAPRTAMV